MLFNLVFNPKKYVFFVFTCNTVQTQNMSTTRQSKTAKIFSTVNFHKDNHVEQHYFECHLSSLRIACFLRERLCGLET